MQKLQQSYHFETLTKMKLRIAVIFSQITKKYFIDTYLVRLIRIDLFPYKFVSLQLANKCMQLNNSKNRTSCQLFY